MPETWRPELMPRYAPFSGAIPSPGVDFDQEPVNCVKISRQWIPIVIGALNALTYDCDYVADENEAYWMSSEARRLIVAIARGNIFCVEDTMYLLRQSPTDPCVLQQSVDGGATWTDAFDFALCRPIITPPTLSEVSAQLSATATATATLVAQWTGDPTSIWPDATFEGNENDEMRVDAMCYAVSVLLATLEETIKAQQDNGIDWHDVARLAAKALGVGATLVLAAKEVGLTSLDPKVEFAAYAVIVLSDTVGSWLESVGHEPDLSPLLSADVQQELLCCAMEKCNGSTPSIGVFAGLFAGCDIAGLNDDTAWVLSQLTENASIYLNFLDFVRAGFDAIEGGQSVECGCPELWEVDIDLTLPTLPDYLTITVGQHIPGSGVRVIAEELGGIQRMDVFIIMTAMTPGFNLAHVKLTCAGVDYGGGSSGISTLATSGTQGIPPVVFDGPYWTRAQVPEPGGAYGAACDFDNCNMVLAHLNVSYGNYLGDGYLTRVRLRGAGVNPFV